jgi:hypothetical protein
MRLVVRRAGRQPAGIAAPVLEGLRTGALPRYTHYNRSAARAHTREVVDHIALERAVGLGDSVDLH